MEIHFSCSKRFFSPAFVSLLLAAIVCNVFATLRWLHLLPLGLLGAVLPLIPHTKMPQVKYALWGILAAWLLVRLSPLLGGFKLLANQMFALSQQTQSYEYDFFSTAGQSPTEAVLWLSMLAGTLCALWGNKVNSFFCAGWMLAMAYFGVTPEAVWMVALLLAGLLAAIPKQQGWFYALMVGAVAIGIALSVSFLAPEPNQAVSAWDDHLRDVLAAAPITHEQEPIPSEVPEPELIPQPDKQQEQPDHGVQRAARNILIFILSGLTLVLLFAPAILNDRAAKRSKQARAGFDNADHAASIRAMYLYAQKWRKLSDSPADIPEDVYAIWQEAAYSDHAMEQAQRDAIHSYMKETAEAIWQASDWKKRLNIRYRICL